MATMYDLGTPHPIALYPPLIINAAITGMVPTKDMTPHVPISPDEVVRDALACAKAGATMIHLHARGADGDPTYQKELYADMIGPIREQAPDLILCTSTSGRIHNTFDKRSDVLDLDGAEKPDMGSLTMGSLNFPKQASVNTPEMIQQLAQKMLDKGIVPEIEVFELGMINAAKVLINRDVLRPPFYFNLLLGSIFSIPATLGDLSHMVQSLPHGVQWGAAGIGRFQLTMNFAAVLMGGHVRVGLEDNIFYDNDKTQLATNEMLVKRVADFSRSIGREVATPAQARELLKLPPRC